MIHINVIPNSYSNNNYKLSSYYKICYILVKIAIILLEDNRKNYDH